MIARVEIPAVVLRTVDVGDSGRVVTLLTREQGKLAAFARGARASRRRFAGALEPFTLLAAGLSGGEGEALARLESAAIVRSFHAIRGELPRIACAACAAELSGALLRDLEPHPALFDRLVAYLERLDAAPATPAGLRVFELGALADAGYRPRLDGCARCGARAPEAGEGGPLLFSPGDGGVLCAACAPSGSAGALRLSAGALALLRRLQALGDAGGEPVAPGAWREARDVLERFIERLAGRRLASRRFLDEVGPWLGG